MGLADMAKNALGQGGKELLSALADIEVKGIEYELLLGLSIAESAGAHGRCSLDMRVAKETEPTELLKGKERTVEVMYGEDRLFAGIVTDMQLLPQENRSMVMHVELATMSMLLHRERRTRTFQNEKKTLKTILDEVAKPYKEVKAVLEAEQPEEKIPRLVCQNNETDWEFLTRLAAQLGKRLFVDARSDTIHVSTGVKSFAKRGKEQSVTSAMQVSYLACARAERNTDEKARPIYYQQRVTDMLLPGFGAGSTSKADNVQLAVVESRVEEHGGSLRNYLVYMPLEGIRPSAWQELAGWGRGHLLHGRVLEADAKTCTVKVQFDCDEKQSKDEALAIPYESLAGNYLFAMPDAGDPVDVYYEDSGELVAIGCHQAAGKRAAREDGKKEGGKEKPERKLDERGIMNEGNLLEFTKEGVLLAATAAKKETAATLDAKGIELRAKADVILEGKGSLYIHSAQGQVPDGQTKYMVKHAVGYGQYMAGLGQPPTTMPAPPSGMVGTDTGSVKKAGAQLAKAVRSEEAKRWDKLSGFQPREAKQESAKAAKGGKVEVKAGKELMLKVGDSSIYLKGGKVEVKTRALFQAGYGIAKPPTGSCSFKPGSPASRSAQSMNPAHGAADRKRSKEGDKKIHDRKKISRGK